MQVLNNFQIIYVDGLEIIGAKSLQTVDELIDEIDSTDQATASNINIRVSTPIEEMSNALKQAFIEACAHGQVNMPPGGRDYLRAELNSSPLYEFVFCQPSSEATDQELARMVWNTQADYVSSTFG